MVEENLPGNGFTINGVLLHNASSKIYFCEGTRKKRNGAITSPFGPIINLTRSNCEVATSMFDQIGHTQRFEDDRYQADMMVCCVTNLEVVA